MVRRRRKKPDSLFVPVVPEGRLNAQFRYAMSDPTHAPARRLVDEIWHDFEDRDGNFVEQYQTTGFDSRTWELYLFAYFRAVGFDVRREHDRPDFILEKNGNIVCVEAVTTAPTQGAAQEDAFHGLTELEETRLKKEEAYPIKFGSALYSKLQKKYWELEQVEGRPFIVAIAPFHASDSLEFSDNPLSDYLYGVRQAHHYDGSGNLVIETHKVAAHTHGAKQIPSGFFDLPDVEHVSAVFFNNSGTEPRFNRMAVAEGDRVRDVLMLRYGTCYNPDSNAAKPSGFIYQVGDPDFPETWGQGGYMNHNPHALLRIDEDLFPEVLHSWRTEEGFFGHIPFNHVFASKTLMFRGAGLHKLRVPGVVVEDSERIPDLLVKLVKAIVKEG